MKAKDLIMIFNGVNPESEVSFSLGRTKEYRDICAKVELIEGECLDFLTVDKIDIYPNDDEMWVDVILKEDNHPCLEENAKNFDKMYTKNEEQFTESTE